MCKSLVIFILLLLCNFVSAQIPEKPTAKGRLQVAGGGNLIFNVNSFSKARDGVKYDDYTTLKVYFSDPNNETTGWDIFVIASSSDFAPDFGTVPLPLKALKLSLTGIGVSGQPITLSSSEQKILSSSDNSDTNMEIKVSYELGTNGELRGYMSDYFSTDLVFILRSR